jgi:O-succinylbenzoate synthase
VRFEVFELRRVRLPLVTPFRSAHGTEAIRDALLVRARAPEAEGWGECVAMSTRGYAEEDVDGAHRAIADALAPRLLGVDVRGIDVAERLSPVTGHPMAKAALEAAVLDAELRGSLAPVSLSRRLGGVRDRVPAGVAVGLHDTVDALVRAVGTYVDQGYARVKLKIEPGRDVDFVAAVRRAHPEVLLQADANECYTLDDLDRLTRLDDFDLLLLEQPFPRDDLAGHVALAARLRTPICLDESIGSAADAETAVAAGACSVVNVKAGRVGGLLEAVRVHDVCRAAGARLWCGGMLETGVGRAANLALASLPGFTLPGDLSASDRYFERDVTPPFVLDDGHLAVPTGPGLGVEPDPAALAALTTSVEEIRNPLAAGGAHRSG